MHPPHQHARVVKGVLISAIMALVISAFTAASALASPVPARWVSPGSATLSGTMTIKLNGSNAKTCTANAAGEAINGGGEGALLVSANPYGIAYLVIFNCTGGTQLWVEMPSVATYGSGYLLTTESAPYGWTSPYGAWNQESIPMPFTNAVGETPSHVTLSETKLGQTASGTITASGTLNIKGKGGSALTLTH